MDIPASLNAHNHRQTDRQTDRQTWTTAYTALAKRLAVEMRIRSLAANLPTLMGVCTMHLSSICHVRV